MNTVGIIGAMDIEVALLKAKLENVTSRQVAGLDFSVGTLGGNDVVVARCHVGKVNAAICTQILIDIFGVDRIINTGIAGAISQKVDIGDVVVSTDLVHHDFDISGDNSEPYVNASIGEAFFKASEHMVQVAEQSCQKVLGADKVHVGRIATGDQFVASSAIKQRISGELGALCVEMEGAAIAQACWLNKVPFVVIRSISDKADLSAFVNFDTFAKQAADISSAIVEDIVAKGALHD